MHYHQQRQWCDTLCRQHGSQEAMLSWQNPSATGVDRDRGHEERSMQQSACWRSTGPRTVAASRFEHLLDGGLLGMLASSRGCSTDGGGRAWGLAQYHRRRQLHGEKHDHASGGVPRRMRNDRCVFVLVLVTAEHH